MVERGYVIFPSRSVLGLLLLASSALFSNAWAGTLHIEVTDPQGRPQPYAVVAATWNGAPAPSPNPEPQVMTQRDMTFVPHVLAIPTNASVMFPNYDQTRHHVYSFSEAKTFDIKLYAGLPERPIEFEQPGVVAIGCNIHDEMRAYIYVSDAPRLAVTGRDGRITFDSVPDQPVTLTIWHEWLDSPNHTVTRQIVTDKRDITAIINISPPPAPQRASSDSIHERFNRIAQ